MSTNGFTLDQLMELAGFSVAIASDHFLKTEYISSIDDCVSSKSILILCGPGNNGGDGMVAARHLKHFTYSPTIVLPNLGKNIFYNNLVKQCEDKNIPILKELPPKDDDYDLIIDAVFGFSFLGPPKEPYSNFISFLASTNIPVISVDVPSGWDVDQGDIYDTKFKPSAVVSLTLPKLCMKDYKGFHFVGGRFIPPNVADKF